MRASAWLALRDGAVRTTGKGRAFRPVSHHHYIHTTINLTTGVWKAHKTPQGATYGERGQQILDAMWDVGMIQDAKYVHTHTHTHTHTHKHTRLLPHHRPARPL